MKTVLLTGANGFLGGHICRELVRRGYGVRAFIRPGADQQTLDSLPVDIWHGDLLDKDNVRAAVYGCDAIIHAGAVASVNPARDPHVRAVNIQGTATTVMAALQAQVQRYVYVGTANVFGFGSKEYPGTEQSPYRGRPYGLDYMDSKRAATDLVLDAVQREGLPGILVHPTFMVGPIDYKITSNALLLALARGHVPAIPAGGKNYVHVADVAVATVNALTLGRVGESYILGNENMSYRESFRLMSQTLGVRPPRLLLPRPVAQLVGWLGDRRADLSQRPSPINAAMAAVSNDEHYFSVSKAVHELKLPQTPIRVAVEQAVAWFRRHGSL
ncbi:NAD-dependent epimerase/dehydratase family protein [Spirosoma luteolum]